MSFCKRLVNPHSMYLNDKFSSMWDVSARNMLPLPAWQTLSLPLSVSSADILRALLTSSESLESSRLLEESNSSEGSSSDTDSPTGVSFSSTLLFSSGRLTLKRTNILVINVLYVYLPFCPPTRYVMLLILSNSLHSVPVFTEIIVQSLSPAYILIPDFSSLASQLWLLCIVWANMNRFRPFWDT